MSRRLHRRLEFVRRRRILFVAALALLLLAAACRSISSLLLVYFEPGVAFFFVPFEAGEVGVLEFVVGLRIQGEYVSRLG